MTPLPLAAPERQARRDQLLAAAVRRAVDHAADAYRSIKCLDGRHADPQTEGCANDGSGCLCECHDPKDESP